MTAKYLQGKSASPKYFSANLLIKYPLEHGQGKRIHLTNSLVKKKKKCKILLEA